MLFAQAFFAFYNISLLLYVLVVLLCSMDSSFVLIVALLNP